MQLLVGTPLVSAFKVNDPAAELRGIKYKRDSLRFPSPHPSPQRGEGKGEGQIAVRKMLSYLFACGDNVFIPTAELSGILQHFL
jgi:hypothetical protein